MFRELIDKLKSKRQQLQEYDTNVIETKSIEKKEIDEQTKKENIIQERVITYNINENKYHYYSAKHESNGNTYYTKYYNKNRKYSLGTLDLTEEETYEEIKSVIYNLENIEGIETILNVELLKDHVLNNLVNAKRNL